MPAARPATGGRPAAARSRTRRRDPARHRARAWRCGPWRCRLRRASRPSGARAGPARGSRAARSGTGRPPARAGRRRCGRPARAGRRRRSAPRSARMRARDASSRSRCGPGPEGLDRRAQRRHRGAELVPLRAGERPADVDQRAPVAERERERPRRIGQVRVESSVWTTRVVPVLRLQPQLLAVLGVEGEAGILREGVAQGHEEGVVSSPAERPPRRARATISPRRSGSDPAQAADCRATSKTVPSDPAIRLAGDRRPRPLTTLGTCPSSTRWPPPATSRSSSSPTSPQRAARHHRDPLDGARAGARRRPLLALRVASEAALRDALRLARGDDLQGGRGGPRPGRRQGRRDARSRRHATRRRSAPSAAASTTLGGRYIAAEDVGATAAGHELDRAARRRG